LAVPYWLARQAEAYQHLGLPAEGLRLLAEAIALTDKTEERWYEAELHRLQGELWLEQADSDAAAQAEACFQRALALARNQQAKSWELRTATSLARLWQDQSKQHEAHELLAPIHGWFSEGFDTADLKDAQRLLIELADADSGSSPNLVSQYRI
jgi:predicted ATPase